MTQGFFNKIVNILKKDVKDVFSTETLKKLGKFSNTDVSDLVGDLKAARLLSEIDKNPEKEENYIQLAAIYRDHNKLEKAVDIYLGLAQTQMRRKGPDKAANFVNMGLKVMPNHGPLNMFSADLDLITGKISDASKKCRIAASYFLQKNDRLTAIYLFRRIMDMNRATTPDLLNLASIMIHEEMFDEAIQILQSIRKKYQNETAPNLRDKEACLLMLYSLKKDDLTVLGELIETRIETQQYESAMILLKKLVLKDPENINFLKRQAFVYKQMNDMVNCVKIFKIIANLYQKNNNLVYRNIYYHKVLKYSPNDVEALTVLKMDDQLRENLDNKIENTDSKIKMAAP